MIYRLLLRIGSLFLFLALLTLASIAYITLSVRRETYSSVSSVPPTRVAIVFGAQVNPNGSLSPILQDRVDAGIALYKAGVVSKLLLSGDNSTIHYDEPVAMQKYALGKGVPPEDMTLDYAGFSTYETCYRAHAVFGLSQAVLVTQQYHMPRALYTCEHLGLTVTGLALPDFEKYPDLRLPLGLREYGADIKALWELHVTHPKPTFLGPAVTI